MTTVTGQVYAHCTHSEPCRDRAEHHIRVAAFSAMSTAASRHGAARRAAGGHPPGHPARVRAADLNTSLADRRAAHTLACGLTPDEIAPNGIATLAGALRTRREGRRRR